MYIATTHSKSDANSHFLVFLLQIPQCGVSMPPFHRTTSNVIAYCTRSLSSSQLLPNYNADECAS